MYFKIPDFRNNLLNRDIADVRIEVVKNENQNDLVLKKTIIEYDWKGQNMMFEDDWEISFNDNISINIFDTIKASIFKTVVDNFNGILATGFPFNFQFSLKLVILYNGRNYTYKKNFKGDFTNINERLRGTADFRFFDSMQ
jgi:hypothetical protein